MMVNEKLPAVEIANFQYQIVTYFVPYFLFLGMELFHPQYKAWLGKHSEG